MKIKFKNADKALGRPITPRDLVVRLRALEAACKYLGVSTHPLNPIRQTVIDYLESLPVHTDDIATRPSRWQGFVLAGGEWWPCVVVNEIDTGPYKGGCEYRIDYADGASESGVVLDGRWAHCTADQMPNFHWVKLEDEPAAVIDTQDDAEDTDDHPDD